MDYKYQRDDPASVQGRLFHDGEIMNPGIIPYLCGWPPHGSVAVSLEVIRKFFSNDHTWALVLKETGEPIGCMGYYPYGESNISIGENDPGTGNPAERV